MVGKGIPGLAGGNQGLACETIDGYWIPGAILWWKVVLRGTSRRVFFSVPFVPGFCASIQQRLDDIRVGLSQHTTQVKLKVLVQIYKNFI